MALGGAINIRVECGGAFGFAQGSKFRKGAVMVMDARSARQWLPTALKACALSILVMFNSACVGASVEKEVEQVSLVEAWKMKMTRQGADHVVIAFSPMLSTMYNRPGANYKSDGKTLWVNLPKCRVQTECPVMVPSTLNRAPQQGRWYEVVIPYRGERVLVSGSGPVEEELPLMP